MMIEMKLGPNENCWMLDVNGDNFDGVLQKND